MTWVARVRTDALLLTDFLEYTSLTLVANYNTPSTLVLEGDLDDLRAAMVPGYGIVVMDGATQRFSGFIASPDTAITRRGDRTGQIVYTSDLERIWDRIAWARPAEPWTNQIASSSATYVDRQSGPLETRLLAYIDRNAGPGARVERRVAKLRLPASLGRGETGTTGPRFVPLGELIASMAERANLRVDVVQTYTNGVDPWLDVTVVDAPDLTGSIRISTPAESGDLFLAEDWFYSLGSPTTTTALGYAGEDGARTYSLSTDAAEETRWKRRVERLIDQAGATEATEIATGLTEALTEGAGAVEISLPIESRTSFDLPLGAKVSAVVDGEVVTERIRQITTAVSGESGSATETVTAILGTAEAGFPSVTAKRLANALKRIKRLEAR